MKLAGDTRVRCDRPEYGNEHPWIMARCLTALYTPLGVVEDDELIEAFADYAATRT